MTTKSLQQRRRPLSLHRHCRPAVEPRHHHHHVVISTLVMLMIAVFVQLSFWESVPVWHHLVFFTSILVAMHLGSLVRKRQLLRAMAEA